MVPPAAAGAAVRAVRAAAARDDVERASPLLLPAGAAIVSSPGGKDGRRGSKRFDEK